MINGKLFLLSRPGARYVLGRLHSPLPHPLPARLIKFSYILVTAQFCELYIKKLFRCSPLCKRIALKVSVHESLSLKYVRELIIFLPCLIRALYSPWISFIQGITLLQDAGTSDDSGRASERLTGSSVAPRDPDSSRDRLSDVSISPCFTWLCDLVLLSTCKASGVCSA